MKKIKILSCVLATLSLLTLSACQSAEGDLTVEKTHPETVDITEKTPTEQPISGTLVVTTPTASVDFPHSETTVKTTNSDHAYGEWQIVREPSCTEEGRRVRICNDCGNQEEDVLAAQGHGDFRYIGRKDPTDLEKGYSGDKVCGYCGVLVEEGKDLPALGHIAGKDGKCIYCGIDMIDKSGDFGENVGWMLRNDDEKIVLEKDDEIREFISKRGFGISPYEGARFESLYQSKDLFVVLYSFEKSDNQYLAKYYVYDIYLRNLSNFYTVVGGRDDLHDLVAQGESAHNGAVIAAVNGDYCGNKSQCKVSLHNGSVYRAPTDVDSDVCVMYNDGSIADYSFSDFDYQRVLDKGAYQIWNFGPGLLNADGSPKSEFDDTPYGRHVLTNVHPRTALGYYQPGHYCFVVSDGRQEDENGNMLYGSTVAYLAKIMSELGCKSAYNLDGGDSSQAYMNGKDVRIDTTREEQRKLSDIICIGEVNN